MATIRKRSWESGGEIKTAWVADYFDQHGKRRLKTFPTKKAADGWLVEARGQVASGTHTAESTSKTLGEAVDEWLRRAAAERLEASTQEQYRQHAAHIRALIPDNPKLSRITESRVEAFKDAALLAHNRPMARKLLASLKAVLKKAKRAHVAADVSIGAGKRHKRKLKAGVDFPLPGEVRAMLKAGGPKERAMVALAALAGLRASELRGLPWSDVNLGSHPAVTVSQRADRWARVGSPKSESSQRMVPLAETAARALREWKLAQPPGRALAFGTARDKPDMLGNLQRRLLTPLCASARGPRYGWHSLRHYAISSWLASGVDLKTAQTWAGHATLALTLDTYGHLIPRADDHQRIAAAEQALLAT